MLEIGAFILMTTGFSLYIQDRYKVPLPITLLILVFGLKSIGVDLLDVSNNSFDEIILLLLPVLISVDVLNLKLSDLKNNAVSLFYIAGISVLLSVFAGIVVNKLIFPEIEISPTSLALLLCMIMATDPIATSAIFSNFKVSHKLKILAEGESLFNDATALIIFTIMLQFVTGTSPSIIGIATTSFMIVFGAIITGLVVGVLGLFLLSLSKNPMIETVLMLSISFISYILAEHFHVSGILSIIVSVLVANHVITNRLEQNEKNKTGKLRLHERFLAQMSSAIETKFNHNLVKTNIQFIALLGTVVLFLSMGDIIHLELLTKYWKEIFSVFIAGLLIRAVMVAKFSVISNKTHKMQNISLHWYLILSSAGVKGGLSILMLHMLPKDFEFKELFEAIVVGNILLSTFVYPIVMAIVLNVYKERFSKEALLEKHEVH